MSYIYKMLNFDEMRFQDSSKVIENKILKLFPDKPLTYNFIAYRLLSKSTSNLDSVEYYLNKASALSGKAPFEQKGSIYASFGDLYHRKGDLPKALDYYLKALSVFQKAQRELDILNMYKQLYTLYGYLNNKEKNVEYYNKYNLLRDKIGEKQKKAMAFALKKISDEEKVQHKSERIKIYTVSLIFIILLSALVIYFRKKYINKQKEKEKEILESTIVLD
ncbi:tetratricopeptide repeat protein [Chryseobacterium daecheongense]|nr:tetratricopeptide repeat protein [Chryseobacterium daecheongense]